MFRKRCGVWFRSTAHSDPLRSLSTPRNAVRKMTSSLRHHYSSPLLLLHRTDMMLEIEAMFESLKIDPTSLGSSAEDDDVDFDEFDRSAWSDRSLIPSPTPSTNPAHDPLARSILSSSSTSAEIRNSALSAPLSSSATRPITNSSSSNNALSANSASPKLFLHLDVLPGLIDSRFLEMNAPGALAALTAAITKTSMHGSTSFLLFWERQIRKPHFSFFR